MPDSKPDGRYGRHLRKAVSEGRQVAEAERIAQEVATGAQRQDSLAEQLHDVRRIAVALGCYDAADYLRDDGA